MSTAAKGSILFRAAQNEDVAVISGCSISRQLGFGTDWTHIRAGIRFNYRQPIGGIVNLNWSGFATANTPRFGLGFCASNTPTRAAQSSYWVGAMARGGPWLSQDQGTQDYTMTFADIRACSAQGGLFSIGGSFSTQFRMGGGAEAPIKFLRTLFFVDLIKNGANLDLKIFFTQAPHIVTAATRASFLTRMVENPPVQPQYIYSSAVSLPDNQAAFGTLNAINLFYARTGPEIEVQDIGMVRLS